MLAANIFFTVKEGIQKIIFCSLRLETKMI